MIRDGGSLVVSWSISQFRFPPNTCKSHLVPLIYTAGSRGFEKDVQSTVDGALVTVNGGDRTVQLIDVGSGPGTSDGIAIWDLDPSTEMAWVSDLGLPFQPATGVSGTVPRWAVVGCWCRPQYGSLHLRAARTRPAVVR